MIDVSIIIPTYNRLWSLPRAVKSCFDSNLNIEVVVVDDGSTDNTWQWLIQQDNITVIHQENMGKDWAVNKGAGIAKGKYIRFLDSDDWLLPYSTDKLFEKAEQHNFEVVCAGYSIYDDNEGFIKEIQWTPCDDFLAQQLGECDSSHYSAYMFKKDFINNIPHRQEYGALDDRKFIIEVAIEQPTTGYISTPTLAHCIHFKPRLQANSGLAQSVNHWGQLNIYKKSFTILESRGCLTQRRKNAGCNILWPLSHWIAQTDLHLAVQTVNWLFELNPNFQIPEQGTLGWFYRNIGFKRTEQILKLRRFILNAFR